MIHFVHGLTQNVKYIYAFKVRRKMRIQDSSEFSWISMCFHVSGDGSFNGTRFIKNCACQFLFFHFENYCYIVVKFSSHQNKYLYSIIHILLYIDATKSGMLNKEKSGRGIVQQITDAYLTVIRKMNMVDETPFVKADKRARAKYRPRYPVDLSLKRKENGIPENHNVHDVEIGKGENKRLQTQKKYPQ